MPGSDSPVLRVPEGSQAQVWPLPSAPPQHLRGSPGAGPREAWLLATGITAGHQGCHHLLSNDGFCQLHSSLFRLTSG